MYTLSVGRHSFHMKKFLTKKGTDEESYWWQGIAGKKYMCTMTKE
jgi:hypothetical protein